MKLPSFPTLTVSAKTVSGISKQLLAGEYETVASLSARAEVSSVTAGKVVRAWRSAEALEERSAERDARCVEFRVREDFAAFGILYRERRGGVMTIASWDGKLLGTERIPYDDAMSPEGNEALLRGRWHEKRAALMRCYSVVGLGVILREGEMPFEALANEADWIEEETALTARALSRGDHGKTVLYLDMEKETRALLALEREWRTLRVASGIEKRVERLTDWIISTANLIPVDGIVAESHGRYEGEATRLLRRLEREWKTRTEMPLPKVYFPDELRLAENEMRRALNDALAEQLTATATLAVTDK